MPDLQQPKAKGIVDIAFLIDCTGSMQPCINALTENIYDNFISILTSTDANNSNPVKDWRAKVVGFRDFEVDSEPYIDNPFVRDPQELKRQFSRLKADGGGDEPESLLDGLYRVAKMGQTEKDAAEDANKWRYRSSAARVVVTFSDATYKATMSLPEAKGGTFEDVKNAIQDNRIILSIFAPDMECYDKLSELDKSEYEAIEVGPDGPQKALENYTKNREHFKRTLEQLAKSISKSAAVETL